MDSEARYILVGSILIAVSLLLVAGIIWLSGAGQQNDNDYTIYFRHQSMNGLDISSPVELRGIKIGEVSDYAFTNDNSEAVKVHIKVIPNTPIHVDSIATVDRNIVTGLASIDISNPHIRSPLMPGTKSRPWPVIAEGRSDFDKVATTLGEISNRAAQTLTNINQLLSADNQRHIASTLNNLQQFSALLAAHGQQLSSSIDHLNNAAAALTDAAQHVSALSDHADNDLVLLTQHTDASLQQATQILLQLQQQSVILSQDAQRLADTGSARLNQIGNDIHQDSLSIQEVGRKLDNPGQIFFNNSAKNRAPGE